MKTLAQLLIAAGSVVFTMSASAQTHSGHTSGTHNGASGHTSAYRSSSTNSYAGSSDRAALYRQATVNSVNATVSAARQQADRQLPGGRPAVPPDLGPTIGSNAHVYYNKGESAYRQSVANQAQVKAAIDRAYTTQGQTPTYTSGFRQTPKSAAHDRGAIDVRMPANPDTTAKAISQNLGPSNRPTVIVELPNGVPLRNNSGYKMEHQYSNGQHVRSKATPIGNTTGPHFHVQPPSSK